MADNSSAINPNGTNRMAVGSSIDVEESDKMAISSVIDVEESNRMPIDSIINMEESMAIGSVIDREENMMISSLIDVEESNRMAIDSIIDMEESMAPCAVFESLLIGSVIDMEENMMIGSIDMEEIMDTFIGSITDVEIQSREPQETLPDEAGFFSLKSMQIPRFPSNLRWIGREGERDYIAPRTVAIGPYYHGVPGLEPMEKVKRIAVESFFKGSGMAGLVATYEKIKSIARDARGCYADEDALQGITDDKFAEIMFVDGCFLVQFIDTVLGSSGDASLRGIIHPHIVGILRDMMLLENQVPWAVMEVLMPLKSLKMEDIIRSLVDQCLHGTTSNVETKESVVGIDKDCKPSHLLCLAWFSQVAGRSNTSVPKSQLSGNKAIPACTSVVDLAEIGIKLEACQMQFSAMDIAKGPLFAKLSMAPLNLDATVYCWLVNMAAFEMWAETFKDNCYVNSYLVVLSQLMSREEDVHELRLKGIVRGSSSDQETLQFFNDLSPNLSTGKAYWRLMRDLEEYRQKRWMWVNIYRFVYKNSKTIATVLPIVSVLAGILKAVLSLKQPPAH